MRTRARTMFRMRIGKSTVIGRFVAVRSVAINQILHPSCVNSTRNGLPAAVRMTLPAAMKSRDGTDQTRRSAGSTPERAGSSGSIASTSPPGPSAPSRTIPGRLEWTRRTFPAPIGGESAS